MAAGDAVVSLASIATVSYANCQPANGNEWVIHNIYHEADVELYYSDGTNNCLVDKDTGGGRWSWEEFHCNYTYYIRIKNTNANSKLIGYDGVVTK